MPRVEQLTGVLDDGTAAVQPPPSSSPIQVAYGESFTLHLIVRNPSGRQIRSSPTNTISYGARRSPLPSGQLLFQHVAQPAADGGWDCPIVRADYKLIFEGAGRFFFDLWFTDNSGVTSISNPVAPLAAFIVTPAAVDPLGPTSLPIPTPLTVF